MASAVAFHSPVHKNTVEKTENALKKTKVDKATGPMICQPIYGKRSCIILLNG